MTWCKDECNRQNKSPDETQKIWKASEASVLRHHNSPALQEDLVSRFRMAPERNGRGREEVKLSCFLDKWVKPMNLERLNKLKERIPWRWTKRKHSIGQGTGNTARKKSLSDKIDIETTPVKWISKKRTRSSQFEMMCEESNITMPPEEEIEDRSLE